MRFCCFFLADLYIVPVEGTLAHDEQVSMGISRTESLLTEGQEAGGALQEDQSWYAIRHSTHFPPKQHGTGREIGLGSCGAMMGIHSVLKNKTNSGHNRNHTQIVLSRILSNHNHTNFEGLPSFQHIYTTALLNSQISSVRRFVYKTIQFSRIYLLT